MRKSVGFFWLALAVFYLGLAFVSYHYGEVYDQKIAKAPTMQATSQGATVLPTPSIPGGSIVLGGSSGQGDAAVVDLWKDLRAYLNASTWVNLGGFALAAVAALVSFVSSRSEAR
jgi:hypothetical protein